MYALKDIFVGAVKMAAGVMMLPGHHAKWDMSEAQRARSEHNGDQALREGGRQFAKGLRTLFAKDGWVSESKSLPVKPNGKFLDL